MAYILSLVILALCTSLAVTMASSVSLNLARVENMQKSFDAQTAAESGLAFMMQSVSGASLPEETDYDTLMSNLAGSLGGMLNDTPNLGGAVVSNTDSTVEIPSISLGDMSFASVVTRLAPDAAGNQRCRVAVVGTSGGMSRSVSLDVRLKPARPGVFNYGVASKGTLSMSGNSRIRSMGDADDASVFSAASASTVISANGNPELDGDLYLCSDNIAAVNLTGNVEIGGSDDIDEILTEHTHLEQADPEFPELDLSPFAALATYVLSKKSNNNKTLNNVYIPANMDPIFNGNTTINGIVYIEAPNNVKFNGNLVLNGFIVTEDGSDLPISGNTLMFTGNLSVTGVDALPDTAEFVAVKAYKGTAVLAPGFFLKFSGNNGGINGMIAADQLMFTGNSSVGGELTGTILGLKNLPMKLTGNSEITINRQDDDTLPTGFKYNSLFEVVSGSYAER